MSLIEAVQHKFDSTAILAGSSTLRRGAVSLQQCSRTHIEALVKDHKESVKVSAILAGGSGDVWTLKVSCSCVSFRKGSNCNHIWATLLQAEKEQKGFWNFLTGKVLLRRIDAGHGAARSRSQLQRENSVSAMPPQRHWKLELEDISQRNSQAQSRYLDSVSETTRKIGKVWFEVLMADSQAAGDLVIGIRSQTEWLQSLQTLALTPLSEISTRQMSMASLSQNECHLLGIAGSLRSLQEKEWKILVSSPLYNSVLKEISNAGRLVINVGSGVQNKYIPLNWEPDGMVSFEVQVEKSLQKTDHWELTGRFLSGENEIGLDVPYIVFRSGLMIWRENIARVQVAEAFEWLRKLRVAGPIQVPMDKKEEFLNIISKENFANIVKEIPHEMRWPCIVPTERQPCLTIATLDFETGQSDFPASIEFAYDDFRVSRKDEERYILEPEMQRIIIRDLNWEKSSSEKFFTLLNIDLRQLPPQREQIPLPTAGFPTLARALLDTGWKIEVAGKALLIPKKDTLVEIKSSGIDWFELAVNFQFEQLQMPISAILEALRRKRFFVTLSDGTMGMLPEEWLNQHQSLLNLLRQKDGSMRLHRTQTSLVDGLLSSSRCTLDDSFRLLRDSLNNLSGISPREAPQSFEGTLRSYQKEGLAWLHFLSDFSFGGCLADDMGLGKTIQMLAFLLTIHSKNKDVPLKLKSSQSPSLIVLPRSLVHNWKAEAEKFAPKLRVVDYSRSGRGKLNDAYSNSDLLMVTYGVMRAQIEEFEKHKFSTIILDEAQTIKNEEALVAKAAKRLKGNVRIALSGTPVENHLGELKSLYDFLNPGMLGSTGQFASLFTSGLDVDPEKVKLLARAIKPFLLRRTKEQVLKDLPDKTEQTLICEMPESQQLIYDNLKKHFKNKLVKAIEEDGLNKSRFLVLEALLRLRQAACHPGLIAEKFKKGGSVKIDILLEHLKEVLDGGHKALVFSQFTSLLSLVADRLKKENIEFEYLDGKTSRRDLVVKRFQESPSCKVFLLSLKAGGVGLNLTSASYCFLLDPWWNPAAESQAIDRMYRIGQKKNVTAYRLIAKGTVEEKIIQLQERKRGLAREILQGTEEGFLKKLSIKDIEMLLE